MLKPGEVPALTLGGGQRLGWTTWLGTPRRQTPPTICAWMREAFVDREEREPHE